MLTSDAFRDLVPFLQLEKKNTHKGLLLLVKFSLQLY